MASIETLKELDKVTLLLQDTVDHYPCETTALSRYSTVKAILTIAKAVSENAHDIALLKSSKGVSDEH